MQCMNIENHLNKTQPKNFAKTSLILKNPKIFQKPQKLGKKEWNAWLMWEGKSYQRKENTFETED